MKEEDKVKNSEVTKIARAILYITAFLVLVRCDLWVSLVVLIGVSYYMLQMGLIKKKLGLFHKLWLLIVMIKQGMASSMLNELAQKADAEKQEKSVIESFDYQNDLNQVNLISEPPEDFWGNEISFDEIWSNPDFEHHEKEDF